MFITTGGKKSMFKIFKRNQAVISGMDELQKQQEKFDVLMEEHRVQFDRVMESNKKASKLMKATCEFAMSQCMSQQNTEQYEQAKKQLISSLRDVKEDELLKQNQQVQELVEDIYRNMDDKEAMLEIISRINILANALQTPDIPGFANLFNISTPN